MDGKQAGDDAEPTDRGEAMSLACSHLDAAIDLLDKIGLDVAAAHASLARSLVNS